MHRATLLLFGLLSNSVFALEPPAPALEHGLTRCGFREEFDDSQGIDIRNSGEEGFRFYTKVPYSSRTIDETEASVANGILTLECRDNVAQGDLYSTYKVSDTEFLGWYHDMAEDGPVYFEARFRWDWTEAKAKLEGRTARNRKGFPAFWANPVEFVDGRKDAPFHYYTELDFFEFNPEWFSDRHDCYLQGLPPWQREPGGRWTRYKNPVPERAVARNREILPHYPASWITDIIDPVTGKAMTSESWNRWQTVGFLVIPGDGTPERPTRCISYFNSRKMKERIDTSDDGDGTWRESKDALKPDDVGFTPMPGLRHQRYMIILGSGCWKTQWDWVRAWQSPLAHRDSDLQP